MTRPVHVVTWEQGYESGLVGVYSRKALAENALAAFIHGLEDNGGGIEHHQFENGYRWERVTGDRDDYQSVIIYYGQEVRTV